MDWIGLDIGGENVKLATKDGQFSFPFELWKHPQQLAGFLEKSVAVVSKGVQAAVTMTGELADGYPTRQIGVREIVQFVETRNKG